MIRKMQKLVPSGSFEEGNFIGVNILLILTARVITIQSILSRQAFLDRNIYSWIGKLEFRIATILRI